MKKDQQHQKAIIAITKTTIKLVWLLSVFAALFLGIEFYFNIIQPQKERNNLIAQNKAAAIQSQLAKAAEQPIQNGIHLATGLIDDEHLNLVIGACTPCHSAKLITQNRASYEGWEEMIRWMQRTQKLGPLGENEPFILSYLAKNYGPEKTGRRSNLIVEEWYKLDL